MAAPYPPADNERARGGSPPQFWEGTPARPPFSRLIAAEKEAYFFLLYGVSESGSSVRSFPSYWK